MRRIVALSLAGALACAPSASISSGRDRYPVRVVGPAGSTSMMVRSDDNTTSGVIAVAPEDAWRALPAVFDSLGIPLTRVDPSNRIIANDGFRVRQRLRDVPLSRYFDCGSTQVGPNADSYQVLLVIVARLRPAAAGMTTLDLSIDAHARSLAFSQAYASCTPLGTLDARFRELLRAHFAR